MADSNTNTNFIHFFGNGQADAGSALRHLVGGKGASLADMTKAGFNVPPGFTISAECCRLYFQNPQRCPAGWILFSMSDRGSSWLRRLMPSSTPGTTTGPSLIAGIIGSTGCLVRP